MEQSLSAKWITKKKKNNPGQRWGHAAILKNKYIYIISGRFEQKLQQVYRLSLDSLQFQPFPLKNTPEPRDSHAVVLWENRIFIWGGCLTQEEVKESSDILSNQMWEIGQERWIKINQKNPPKGRQGHMLTSFPTFILLFGGFCFNQLQNQEAVYPQQFYRFYPQNNSWEEVQTIGYKVVGRENATMTKMGDFIWIYGGHRIQNNKEIYQKDIIRGHIMNKRIMFQRINITDGIYPPPRAEHSAVPIGHNLYILNGQGENPTIQQEDKLLKIVEKSQQAFPKNDVWVFSVKQLKWREVITKGKRSPRMNFSAIGLRDRIICYGGMQNIDLVSDQLSILCLQYQQKQIPSKISKTQQICSLCTHTFFPNSSFQQIQPLPTISTLFLQQTSLLISSPFVALTQFFNTLENNKFQKVSLQIYQGHIRIKLNKWVQGREWNNLGGWLKKGGFRLGLSICVTNNYQKKSRLYLCINNKKVPINPFHPFYYQEDKKGNLLIQNTLIDRKVILNDCPISNEQNSTIIDIWDLRGVNAAYQLQYFERELLYLRHIPLISERFSDYLNSFYLTPPNLQIFINGILVKIEPINYLDPNYYQLQNQFLKVRVYDGEGRIRGYYGGRKVYEEQRLNFYGKVIIRGEVSVVNGVIGRQRFLLNRRIEQFIRSIQNRKNHKDLNQPRKYIKID